MVNNFPSPGGGGEELLAAEGIPVYPSVGTRYIWGRELSLDVAESLQRTEEVEEEEEEEETAFGPSSVRAVLCPSQMLLLR